MSHSTFHPPGKGKGRDMAVKFILSEYIALAMAQAAYDKLEDGTFAGRIPSCPGVIAFAGTLRQCEEELRSTLEDWLLVGLKMGYSLPGLDMASLS
jgi:predicted RNase H-like HicB family nuclease